MFCPVTFYGLTTVFKSNDTHIDDRHHWNFHPVSFPVSSCVIFQQIQLESKLSQWSVIKWGTCYFTQLKVCHKQLQLKVASIVWCCLLTCLLIDWFCTALCCIVLYWDIYKYEKSIYLSAKMNQSDHLMVLIEQ